MKNLVYIVLVVLFSSTVFSCGVAKETKLKQNDEVTFTLKENKEIVKQQILKKPRTIIATP